MCGEKSRNRKQARHAAGSPPHVRGKAGFPAISTGRFWITPACAGKRAGIKAEEMHIRDHPRMCGEKRPARGNISAPWGSPPHVRGKGRHLGSLARYQRITPACAGKSALPCCFQQAAVDHPRMCGEKCPLNCWISPIGGSPPHVRGKGFFHFSHEMLEGITPACAGKRRKEDAGRNPG